MIDFSGYTREAIQKEMLDQVDPNIDTREGSMIQTAIGPTAWYLEGVYMITPIRPLRSVTAWIRSFRREDLPENRQRQQSGKKPLTPQFHPGRNSRRSTGQIPRSS